jgi:hypothetical protein
MVHRPDGSCSFQLPKLQMGSDAGDGLRDRSPSRVRLAGAVSSW